MAPPRSVLVVEDDEALARVLVRLLESCGWRAASESSAEDGLKAIASREFDAVLLDVSLPGMTGLEAIGRFLAASAAPVLVMTGHGDSELRKDAMLLGARAFLLKPISPADLDAALRDAAGGGA